jgi:hypothetical protein
MSWIDSNCYSLAPKDHNGNKTSCEIVDYVYDTTLNRCFATRPADYYNTYGGKTSCEDGGYDWNDTDNKCIDPRV